MLPGFPAATRRCAAACATRKQPRRFTSRTLSQSSSVCCKAGRVTAMPALLTTTSQGAPKAFSAASKARPTAAASVTSSATGTAPLAELRGERRQRVRSPRRQRHPRAGRVQHPREVLAQAPGGAGDEGRAALEGEELRGIGHAAVHHRGPGADKPPLLKRRGRRHSAT